MKKTYRKIFPNYEMELEKAVGNCKSLLDVGCGSSSPIKHFSKNLHCEGVEIFEPDLKKSQEAKIHNKYHQISVLDIGEKFKENSFDCVLASDLIEHLTKEEGNKLIKMMEKIAKKRVIIFTPNGFLPQGEFNKNPWQVHKTGWTVEEMQKKGYKIIGINGIKSLRKEFTTIKYKPRFFWTIISDLTQIWTRNHPKHAFQILCIKDIKN